MSIIERPKITELENLIKIEKKFKIENDTYSEILEFFKRYGYLTQRFEGVPSVPDIWIGRDEDYYWIEVKIYRGPKNLKYNFFIVDDFKWQPGQVRFMKDMKRHGAKDHYLLLAINSTGFCRFFIEGVEFE